MRSYLLVSGVLVGVVLLVLSGYLPRHADATGSKPGRGDTAAPLELRYAEFDAERPVIPHEASHEEDQTPPPPKPAPPVPVSSQPVIPAPMDDHGVAAPGFSAPPTDLPPVVASAGAHRVVWLGRNELTLDGSQSSGEGLTYAWRQLSGPLSAEIKEPNQAKTTVTNVTPEAGAGWEDISYEFELTVTDRSGQQATDIVSYTLRADPGWSVTPMPRKRLAYRDGYLLAHFQVWKTSSTGNSEVFEIRSASELFIHQLGGEGDFGVTVSAGTTGYTYQVTVYYREGQPTTWLELFVDTPDRIPAVLQLGVNWD